MKTIGIPDKTLVAIFIFQGLYISLIVGLILGLITTINLNSIILLIETMFDRAPLGAYFINYSLLHRYWSYINYVHCFFFVFVVTPCWL